jgi:hypothetical protein
MKIFFTPIVAFIILYTCSAYVFVPSTRSREEFLSRTSANLQMTLLSYQGKKVEVKEGTPLSQACVKLGLKPKYDCKK